MSSTAIPPGVDTVVALRRFTNAEVARMASRLDEDEGNEFEFICECGDTFCDSRVTMTVAQFLASSPGSVVRHPTAA
jgi:hypothetical protein